MNIHEYQAKQLFHSYGINVLKGEIAFNPSEAIDIAKGARQRLEELRTELQSQSIDVKENKNFQ